MIARDPERWFTFKVDGQELNGVANFNHLMVYKAEGDYTSARNLLATFNLAQGWRLTSHNSLYQRPDDEWIAAVKQAYVKWKLMR